MLHLACEMNRRLDAFLGGGMFRYRDCIDLWETSQRSVYTSKEVWIPNGHGKHNATLYFNEEKQVIELQEGQDFYVRYSKEGGENAWRSITSDREPTLEKVEEGTFKINGHAFKTLKFKYAGQTISFIDTRDKVGVGYLPTCNLDRADERIPPEPIGSPPPAPMEAEDVSDSEDSDANNPNANRTNTSAASDSATVRHESESEDDGTKPMSPFDPNEVTTLNRYIERECKSLKELHQTYDLSYDSFENLDRETALYLNQAASIHEALTYVNTVLIKPLTSYQIPLDSMIRQQDPKYPTFQNGTHCLYFATGRYYVEKITPGSSPPVKTPLGADKEREIIKMAAEEIVKKVDGSTRYIKSMNQTDALANCTKVMQYFFTQCNANATAREIQSRPYIVFQQDLFNQAKTKIQEIINKTAPLTAKMNDFVAEKINATGMRSRLEPGRSPNINPWKQDHHLTSNPKTRRPTTWNQTK
jgi:hypothetical protein